MATSSEEVLLVVNEVRHQKKDGTLFLMAERLAWQDHSKDIFSVSHFYGDIKQQKISQETSSKIQLQVVLHSGGSSKFHFTNHEGPPAQLKDRNDVKELLQQLLPRFRSRANKELEQKNKMLQDDPELFQLYKDLVMSGVMTADEFWTSRRQQAAVSGQQSSQGTGVSAAFLSEIKPQTDGCNGVKYNLTPDIIEAIFRIYPAVKKKHLDNVPDKMTEKEFWTKFFQSQYFHRDRVLTGNKDLFTECAKHDEKEMQEEADKGVSNHLLDVQGLTDQTLDDGYGAKLPGKSSANQVNTSIVKRFNHHNTRILTASEQARPSSATNPDLSKILPNASEETNNHSTSNPDEPASKKARIRESIQYEDLEQQSQNQAVQLRLQRTEGYYHGPTLGQAGDGLSSTDLTKAIRRVHGNVKQANWNLTQVMPRQLACSAMMELTPGGALMGSSSHQPFHTMYSTDIQQELKRLYSALSELLRHFWACFPVSSKTVEDKLLRMKGTLEQFRTKKLQPFKNSLTKQHLQPNLTNHMEELLQTAFKKFATWQSKRGGKGTS